MLPTPSTSRPLTQLRQWFLFLSDLDPRSLACMRIGLAAVLLYDIQMAWGVIDVWPALQDYYDGLPLPIVPALGQIGTLKLFFVVYALLVVGLLLGWRTRLCAFGVWIFLAAHRHGAQMIDYHDDVLFHVLFWAQFLDLGRAFSLDALARRRGCSADAVERLGALGLVVTLAHIYVETVFEKDGVSWWNEGTAVFFALKDMAYSGPIVLWAVENLPFTVFYIASYVVLMTELFGGLMLLLPKTRLAGWLALAFLQAGLWITMGLESFPATMLSVQMALLPSQVWRRLGAKRPLPGWRLRPPWRRALRWVFLLCIFAVNGEGRRLMYLDDWPYPLAQQVAEARYFFGLQARWQMYAPEPPKYSGWWVSVGYTAAGEEIDLITGRAPTFAPPDRTRLPFSGLGSMYWFAEPETNGGPHDDIARYLLWVNERYRRGDEKLTHFLLFYVYEPFLPIRQSAHERQPLLLLRWPEETAAPRPSLRQDSLLRRASLYSASAKELGAMGDRGWRPRPLPPLKTY